MQSNCSFNPTVSNLLLMHTEYFRRGCPTHRVSESAESGSIWCVWSGGHLLTIQYSARHFSHGFLFAVSSNYRLSGESLRDCNQSYISGDLQSQMLGLSVPIV